MIFISWVLQTTQYQVVLNQIVSEFLHSLLLVKVKHEKHQIENHSKHNQWKRLHPQQQQQQGNYNVNCTLTFVFIALLLSLPSSSHCFAFETHFHQHQIHKIHQINSLSHHRSLYESFDDDGTRHHHLTHEKQRMSDPFFDSNSITNITVAEGSAASYLPCKVHQLGDRTVSWIRRKDLHVLTVGKFTYTSDQRFQAVHQDNSDDWSLQIRFPQRKDAGIYECQVSTLPKMSLFVTFNVIVSKSQILGGPTIYINSGSTLNLTCLVLDTPGPPDYLFWYHNGQVINYDSPRGIKVQTEKSAQQTSSKLIINKALPNDSGNYSCAPSNAEQSHIAVHIHSNPAAASIQHGKRSARNFVSSIAPSKRFHLQIIGLPLILFIIFMDVIK